MTDRARLTGKQDVVESEIPGGGKGLPESNEGAKGSSESTANTIVPVVILVNGQRRGDEGGAEEGSDGEDHLPVAARSA